MTDKKNTSRLYSIDLLRFIAATAVLLYHYTFRGFIRDNFIPVEFPFLSNIFMYGFLGVELFFIISGFVITMSVSGKNWCYFFASRVSRLFPAYLVAVTLTSAAALIFNNPAFKPTFFQYLINLTMLNKFFNIKSVDSVYWTLSIELKFYLIILIILLFNKSRNFKIIFSFWLLLSIIMPLLNVSQFIKDFSLYDWSSYFIAGATFYSIHKNGCRFGDCILIILCYLQSLRLVYWRTLDLNQSLDITFNLTVVLSIVTSFYGIILLISLKKLRQLNIPAFSILGLLTYPLYLIHQNIGYILFQHFSNQYNKYIILFTVIAVITGISYLITKYVEKNLSKPARELMLSITQPFQKKPRNQI